MYGKCNKCGCMISLCPMTYRCNLCEMETYNQGVTDGLKGRRDKFIYGNDYEHGLAIGAREKVSKDLLSRSRMETMDLRDIFGKKIY